MERFNHNIYTCCLREEHSLAGSCCSNCHIGIYMKEQVEGRLADVQALEKQRIYRIRGAVLT